MPARWMEAKLAKMKPLNLRFVEAGTTKEARHTDKRTHDMPEHKHSNDAIVAAYKGKIKRVPCRGVMPARSYGRVCKGHTRAGLNLRPISERAARERPQDFAPKSLLNWAPQGEPRLIKTNRS